MSDVELVRGFWSLWNDDGLTELVARYSEFFTEDLQWRSPVTAVSGAWLTGREEFVDLDEGAEMADRVVSGKAPVS